MSFIEFEHSVAHDAGPPASLSAPLQALWLDAKGDWNGAHVLAQKAGEDGGNERHGRDGAWVHAFLHRKEGDAGNAAYWYTRVGKPVPTGELGSEWREIVMELLR